MEWMIIIILTAKGVAVEKVPFANGGCEAVAAQVNNDADQEIVYMMATCVDASGEPQ